jgi:DNA-binding transcriptional LysR family regulator
MLAEAEAVEADALDQSASPRGVVRLAAPMSFGLRMVAPILPEFLALYPEVQVDLHLSDETIDMIGEGFDVALRIGVLPDSSLRARQLCPVRRLVVASPAYFDRRGRPTHPAQLADHALLGYAYLPTPDVWRFFNAAGEDSAVRPAGPLRANNGDALTPALLAGLGIAVQPDFIVAEALADGSLEQVLPDWSLRDGSLHLMTPPGGPRPARVEALIAFLAKALSPH